MVEPKHGSDGVNEWQGQAQKMQRQPKRLHRGRLIWKMAACEATGTRKEVDTSMVGSAGGACSCCRYTV